MHAHVAQIGADRCGHPEAAQSLVVLTSNRVAVTFAAVQRLREMIVLEQRSSELHGSVHMLQEGILPTLVTDSAAVGVVGVRRGNGIREAEGLRIGFQSLPPPRD